MKSNKIITVNIIMPLISGIATGLAYSGEKLSFLIFLSISPYIYSILIDYKLYKSFIYSISFYIVMLDFKYYFCYNGYNNFKADYFNYYNFSSFSFIILLTQPAAIHF